MASAAQGPGGNRLVLDGQVTTDGRRRRHRRSGRTRRHASCRRAAGRSATPFIVTESERNVVYELGGEPALERLQESVARAPPEETGRWPRTVSTSASSSTSTRPTSSRGDFLVRNVLGVDREAGAVAVGDVVDVGTTVQFQVRDAAAADEDLRELLAGVPADGALLFTCNGRGIRLFGEPDHDAAVVAEALGPRAARRACSAPGELGPSAAATSSTASPRSSRLFERRAATASAPR